MKEASKATDFFVAGGTLRPNAPSYVTRPADDELLKLALAGEFCYILTPRQMGKSSLMIRTARRLHAKGIRTAIIDLTTIGAGTVEVWYLDLLAAISRDLRLSINPEVWWQKRATLGQVQRFTNFLRDVVLTEIKDQVVIFIDEIDTTLNLNFRDDFFAAIRAIYNARAKDAEFNRLSFVLLGVVSPPDLIKDRSRTPFNIGQGIFLKEFSQTDAGLLKDGLEEVHPGQGEAIFNRIYYWTNGHPYLTQKLCLAAVETKDNDWNNQQVDKLVERLFLSSEASKETNLQFVRDQIFNHHHYRELLKLYKEVYQKEEIVDDEQSPLKNRLKLAGLVKTEMGYLRVRNEIYRRVFNLDWIKVNTPIDWIPRIAVVTIVLAVLIALFSIYAVNTITTALTFDYQVRVQEKDTGKPVPNAKVKIEVRAKSPLEAITDSNGLAKISVESSYTGQPAFLIIQVDGYEGHFRNIDLVEGNLPSLIQLEETSAIGSIETPVLITTPTTLPASPTNSIETPTTLPLSISFRYEVRAIAKDTGNNIAGAKVTIEANGNAPLVSITDSEGLARIFFSASEAGQTGRLVVEATGYETYTQNIVLIEGALPDVIQLSSPATPTPTVTPTQIPTLMPPTSTTTPTPPYLPGALGLDNKNVTVVYIPAGEFTMGGSADLALAECQKLYYQSGCQRGWFEEEEPVHLVTLAAFWIDQYEVTNASYAECVHEGACTPPSNTNSFTRASYYGNPEYNDYPVIYVDWFQARTYCQWRGGRLPTEAEWEKAARGEDGRIYPWGNEFDGSRLNFCDKNCPKEWAKQDMDDGYADTAPVSDYREGVSPYGVHNLAGNVWEWVQSQYQAYPYRPDDGRENLDGTNSRVIRGGAWDLFGASVLLRRQYEPNSVSSSIGFRCVLNKVVIR